MTIQKTISIVVVASAIITGIFNILAGNTSYTISIMMFAGLSILGYLFMTKTDQQIDFANSLKPGDRVRYNGHNATVTDINEGGRTVKLELDHVSPMQLSKIKN